MKTFTFCTMLVFLLFLALYQPVNASHGTGGELTWRCLGTGEYVFQLKFYRDCTGIAASNSITISTTVPGMPSIPAPRISQTDISPTGFLSDGQTACAACGGGIAPGIIQENIYESAPVTLNGVPPPQGWEFYWGECCRSNLLSNIATPGSIGFRIMAKMFSYNGQNANPCFDSSPQFVEKPHTIACLTNPVTYHHLSIDSDFDSLTYEFTSPLTDAGNLAVHSPGYSFQNPLPGVTTLNSYTGEMNSVDSLGGYFVTAVMVKAFKCGVLVSENTREINIILLNNCPPVLNGIDNFPPNVVPPFPDPVTGLYTSYNDTVFAGDTVLFSLVADDFQQFTDSSTQVVTFTSFGSQYGDNFTDPMNGCLIPPCATLFPPPPVSSSGSVAIDFNWVTTPAHLGFSYSCVQFANTYYFINKAQDNYCPANGTESKVLSITVMPTIPRPPIVNNNGTLECSWGTGYVYQWFYNRFAIPGANSESHTPVQNGIYQVLAVAPDGNGNYSEGYDYNSVGIYENLSFETISIVPNPSVNGIFNINYSDREASHVVVTAYDLTGRVITTFTIFHNDVSAYTLDLAGQDKGIYILKFENDKGKIKHTKISRL